MSGIVGTAMGDYLFTHPDVNNFFTSLRGLPNEELRGRVQTYMDANPQVQSEIRGIRQPLTDLRNRCDAPTPTDSPCAAEPALTRTPHWQTADSDEMAVASRETGNAAFRAQIACQALRGW